MTKNTDSSIYLHAASSVKTTMLWLWRVKVASLGDNI